MKDKEFAEIVNSTKAVVLSAVQRYLHRDFYHAIDDVVQETYLRAYRSLVRNKFENRSTLETWLYTIAKNEALRSAKKLAREEDKKLAVLKSDKFKIADNDDDSFPVTESIANMIESLPEKYRSVFDLIRLGFSEKEIAERLSISRGTVKSRTSRGREILSRMYYGGEK